MGRSHGYRHPKEVVQRAIERHLDGEAVGVIARDIGASWATVAAWVRAAGREVRSEVEVARDRVQRAERNELAAGGSADDTGGVPLDRAVVAMAARLKPSSVVVTLRVVDDGLCGTRLVAECVADPAEPESPREQYSADPAQVSAWSLRVLSMFAAPRRVARPLSGDKRRRM